MAKMNYNDLRQVTAPVLEMCLQINNVFLFDSRYHYSSEAFFLLLLLHKFLDTFLISRDVRMVSRLKKQKNQYTVTTISRTL